MLVLPTILHIALHHQALGDDRIASMAALILPPSVVVLHLTSTSRALSYLLPRVRARAAVLQLVALAALLWAAYYRFAYRAYAHVLAAHGWLLHCAALAIGLVVVVVVGLVQRVRALERVDAGGHDDDDDDNRLSANANRGGARTQAS